MNQKTTILVTGTPRSGTTWVGRILATAPKTAYLLEPMNLARAAYFDLPVSHWYQRIDGKSDAHFAPIFRRLLSGQQIGRGEPVGLQSLAAPVTTLKQVACQLRNRLTALRAERMILKDPIAILSADWFTQQFDARVVVTIRHPAAVVSSLRLQGWSPDFDDLFHQPEVIETFFPEVEQWLAEHPLRDGDDETVYKGAVLWRLLHQVIRHYQDCYPDWVFVRHEDIARDPLALLGGLFQRLQLPFTESTRGFIQETTTAGKNRFVNEAAPTNVVIRDTANHVDVWKQRLTSDEVRRIRELTEGVVEHFYGDGDWQP